MRARARSIAVAALLGCLMVSTGVAQAADQERLDLVCEGTWVDGFADNGPFSARYSLDLIKARACVAPCRQWLNEVEVKGDAIWFGLEAEENEDGEDLSWAIAYTPSDGTFVLFRREKPASGTCRKEAYSGPSDSPI